MFLVPASSRCSLSSRQFKIKKKMCTSNNSSSSINDLPLEILSLIMEKLEDDTFVKSFFVSKLWRTVIISIANRDSTNRRWKLLYESFEKQDMFKIKSKNLSYQERLTNVLRWHLDLVFDPPSKVYDTATCVKQVHVYKDNIIVVDGKGVKYFNANTQELIREMKLNNCIDFNECDSIMVVCVKGYSTESHMFRLLLHTKLKKTADNNDFAKIKTHITRARLPVYLAADSYRSIIFDDIRHYMIDNGACYFISDKSALHCYKPRECNRALLFVCKFFRNELDYMHAISVFGPDVCAFFEWGQMKSYLHKKQHIINSCYVSVPYKKCSSLWIVHKYCLVIGLPDDYEFRITRYIRDGYYFYKVECPRLTFARDHGDMLILGYNDGKIELFMPRARTRDKMFRGRLNLSDFVKETDPEHLAIISIDVYEELDKHRLVVATAASVFQFAITHPDEDWWCLTPELIVYYTHPVIHNGLHPP